MKYRYICHLCTCICYLWLFLFCFTFILCRCCRRYSSPWPRPPSCTSNQWSTTPSQSVSHPTLPLQPMVYYPQPIRKSLSLNPPFQIMVNSHINQWCIFSSKLVGAPTYSQVLSHYHIAAQLFYIKYYWRKNTWNEAHVICLEDFSQTPEHFLNQYFRKPAEFISISLVFWLLTEAY